MSTSKRFLESQFGDDWGFNLDGSFRAGKRTIKNQEKDMLDDCERCHGTGKVSVMRKIKGRFKPVIVGCSCTRGRPLDPV